MLPPCNETWNRGVSNGPKSIYQQYPPKVLLTNLYFRFMVTPETYKIVYAFIIGIVITAGLMDCPILQ